ncbi:MAG: hypothetical protein R6U26_01330 [Candidatus Undinarchaeales archaeon]
MSELINELRRQLFHFGGLVFVVMSYFIPYYLFLYILIAGIFISFIFLPLKRFLGIKVLDDWLRKEERDNLFLKGIVFFLIGITSVLIFTRSFEIFRVAVLVLVLGDASSTIVGKVFGTKKLPYNGNKTAEGTFAFFIFAFIGAFTQLPYFMAIITALFGAFVESLPLKIDDNLTIPILVGVLLWLL